MKKVRIFKYFSKNTPENRQKIWVVLKGGVKNDTKRKESIIRTKKEWMVH